MFYVSLDLTFFKLFFNYETTGWSSSDRSKSALCIKIRLLLTNEKQNSFQFKIVSLKENVSFQFSGSLQKGNTGSLLITSKSLRGNPLFDNNLITTKNF